ncbi:MCE family protein [Actinomadura verrucosospora]|uniref:Virulence factor Mce family protein n=1 Tax=Actinomadura verrucosospora TaxID=46165 RepID=A0A7D3VYY9_ACTVE|nr:MCE family protein [Actinomadura verrucosospora]QKG27093.1 Virulence factor Mce family protein [Actinomadura verrucosospora]
MTTILAKRRRERRLKMLSGVAFLLVPPLLVWLSIALYNKDFTDETSVTVRTSLVGNDLHEGAEVKLRGVVVGRVSSIDADGSGARLHLELDPAQAKLIPADVRAQMLPTTVFGERYVSLVSGSGAAGPRLHAGAEIAQDRTSDAIELQQVLRSTMALLTDLKPAELSATLTAMSQALNGRGDQLGENLAQLADYLRKLNPHLPELDRNISQLAAFANNYADAAPDLLNALSDMTVTTRTIADQRANLSQLYDSTTAVSQQLETFLRANAPNIIELSANSVGPLTELGRYAPEYPCLFHTLKTLVPLMDRALGKGTDRPGAHVTLRMVANRGRYRPGRDAPRFTGTGPGPRCYGTPYRAGNAVDLAPNGPGEHTLINELSLAGGQDLVPDWGALLIGPLYRGAAVTVTGARP